MIPLTGAGMKSAESLITHQHLPNYGGCIMKQSLFITVLMLAALGIATLIFIYLLPDYIKQGGPLLLC